uniref:ZP domain-containing protein n=1 Tax=Strongyloides venezuelensis TaxID=75913 RepID=A0A0K0EUW4_STRVS
MKILTFIFILQLLDLSQEKKEDNVLYTLIGKLDCKKKDLFAARVNLIQESGPYSGYKHGSRIVLVNQSFYFDIEKKYFQHATLEIYDRCGVKCDNCEIKTTLSLHGNEVGINSNKMHKLLNVFSYEDLHLGSGKDAKMSSLHCVNGRNVVTIGSLSKYLINEGTNEATLELDKMKCHF